MKLLIVALTLAVLTGCGSESESDPEPTYREFHYVVMFDRSTIEASDRTRLLLRVLAEGGWWEKEDDDTQDSGVCMVLFRYMKPDEATEEFARIDLALAPKETP